MRPKNKLSKRNKTDEKRGIMGELVRGRNRRRRSKEKDKEEEIEKGSDVEICPKTTSCRNEARKTRKEK